MLLLLLAEEPRHGYRLLEGVQDLGLAHIDRPSVYRALADLASDGLVRSWDEPPSAGSTRHVYDLTPEGVAVLEEWMSVVADERTVLDLVLQRYWYCNAHSLAPAHPVAAPDDRASVEPPASPSPAEAPLRFTIATDRSNLIVEARSNIGPIAFGTTRLRGWTSVVVRNGLVSVDEPPRGRLEVDLATLTSGNTLYDNELMRRIDARRYRSVSVDLDRAQRRGEGNCFEATGEVTLRGVTRPVTGQLTVTVQESRRISRGRGSVTDRRMTVAGECVLDLREFRFEPPSMPLLKLYPDVRLHLHIEADSLEETPAR